MSQRIAHITCGVFLSGLLSLVAFPSAAAQPQAAPPAQTQPGPNPVRVTPAAKDAVAVVGTFFEALANGNYAVAREQLDPGVVVITSGNIRGGRDVYMSQQSRADAEFLQRSQRTLIRRDAQADERLAWIVSEKLFRPANGAAIQTSETVVVAKGPAGWKIVHIHWSSRPSGAR